MRHARKRSQLGDTDADMSISGSDSNPGPGSDSMDVDSEYGGPAHNKAVIYSNKRPRISDTNTQQYFPKATIMDIPPEIFTEVCKYIRPGDLLSLARCCKSFRNYLMKKANQPIWWDVMNNVRKLPPCPRGFSEPQYLAVLFSDFCTTCGGTKKLQLDVILLVKLCITCQKDRLVQLTNIREVPPDIYQLLHRSNAFGKGKRGQLPEARVLKSHVQGIVEARIKAKLSGGDHALAELEAQMMGAVLERKMLSRKITCALELYENDVGWERTNIRVKRRQEIERRCIDEFEMEREDFQFPQGSLEQKNYYKFLNKSGLLDDREWGEIRAKVKRLLLANRTARQDKNQEEYHPHQPGCQGECAHPEGPLTLDIDPVTHGLYPFEGIEVLA